MAIEFRKLDVRELDVFIDMRLNQLLEEGNDAVIDLEPYLRDYYLRHLSDGTFTSWLAVDNRRIVGTSGISFVEKPPYYGCPTGRIGLLSSMYTLKEYRRQGIATVLLKKVIREAKDFGCGTVHITASEMGVPFYADFGFRKNGSFLFYNL